RRPFRFPGARLPNPDRVGDRVRGRRRRLARDLPRRERHGPSEAPHELAARCFRRQRIELERPPLLAPPARRTRSTTATRRSYSCVRSERRTHHSRWPPSSPALDPVGPRLLAVIAFWWEDCPRSRLRAGSSGLTDASPIRRRCPCRTS